MDKKLLANAMGMPVKKRKFGNYVVSPAEAQTSSQTPKEPNSFEHLGEPEQLFESTFPASQKSQSQSGIIHRSVAITSADGPSEPINDAFAARNAETPDAVVTMDRTVASLERGSLVETESEDRKGLFVQVDSSTSSNNFRSDKNDLALGEPIPLKIDRLHWDLNILMEEWKEPNAGIVNQKSNIDFLTSDGIQNGNATFDPDSIQKIADPQCVLLETKGPDSERNVLQVSSGLTDTEKSGAAFKTQDSSTVISMNDLINKPLLDHTECEFIEQKKNTANIPVQYDKDMSGTPATVLRKLSAQSDTTEKSDSVSFGKPIIGNSACYVGIMKYGGSYDLKKNSQKGPPKLTSKDLSSGCKNLNVSGNNTDHVVSVDSMSNLYLGYESPIEDGELRDLDAYNWKNNEVDFSETGQLDNGLVGTWHHNAYKNYYKNGDQLCGDYQDDADAKGQDCELDDNGSRTREFGARKYRKRLLSPIETPYSGPIRRKNSASMQHQRKYENNGPDVNFPVTYQESRSYDPHYPDSKDHYHSRLRCVNYGPPARGSEMSFYDNKQFSYDIYRPPFRKRSPADRDYSYDRNRRAPFPRGEKKRNRKKKFGFYPQRGKRAPKGEYHERLPGKYSSRRDHNSSANFDQATHTNRPSRKSQSESSLFSPTHVSNEQDQRSSDRVSGQRERQREFPRKLKSDGKFHSLSMHEINPQVVANDREFSFASSDTDRNVHHW